MKTPEGKAGDCLGKIKASKIGTEADRAWVAKAITEFVEKRGNDPRDAKVIHLAAAESLLSESTGKLEGIMEVARQKGRKIDDPFAAKPTEPPPIPRIDPAAIEQAKVEGSKAAGVPPPLPGESLGGAKNRRFAEQIHGDKAMSQELRSAAGNKVYEPISNRITFDQAAAIVEKSGPIESIQHVMDKNNAVEGRVRGAMGQMVLKKLNDSYIRLKTVDPEGAAHILHKKVDLAEWLGEFYTEAGQTSQTAAMWTNISADGKLLNLQRQVRRARSTHATETPAVKELLGVANNPALTLVQKEAAMKKLFKSNKALRKIRSREDKLLEAARKGLLTEENFYNIASDRLGLPQYSPAIAAEVSRLAAEVDARPEGMAKNKAALKLATYIQRKVGFNVRDLATGVYYSNILSGVNTQIINFADTALNVKSEVFGMAVTNPRSAVQIYRGLLRGFLEGKTEFLEAITKGRVATETKWLDIPRLMEIANFGEKGGVPIRVKGGFSSMVKRITESKPGKLLAGYKYVSRAMQASDAVWFRAASEARMGLLANRLAKSEGLSGRALTDRVEQILGLDEMQRIQYDKQARREGYTGREAELRARELRDAQRPKAAKEDAVEFASHATYNFTPEGVLGFLTKKLDGAFQESTVGGRKIGPFPIAKAIIIPFTRIVANVTNRGLEYSGAGFIRGLKEAPGSDARAMHFTRASIGMVGTGLIGVLHAMDIIELSGQGPSDATKRKELEEGGWLPYSIRFGGRSWSYQYTPLVLALGAMGSVMDAVRYKEMKQRDAMTRAMFLFVTTPVHVMFSQSFLSSLSTLFRAVGGKPGDSTSAGMQLVAGVAGGFTTPNLYMDVHKLFDATKYTSDDIMGALLRRTPFSALTNRPALNAFGEPVQLRPFRFTHVGKDEAWDIVVKMKLRVGVPNKYTEMPKPEGGVRKITPEEYDEYLRISGRKIKQAILMSKSRWATLTPEKAQEVLSAKSEAIREKTLSDLRKRIRKGEVIR